jgi:pilus assembly protein CpaE
MSPLPPRHVCVVGAGKNDLEAMLTAGGLRPTAMAAADLPALAQPAARPAAVLVVDLRGATQLPAALPEVKKAHPQTAIVLVVGALETSLMLEAIRCGVTECVVEPVTEAELLAAVSRMSEPRQAPSTGQVFGIVGAKGGVGATTVAVNLAAELARIAPRETLLVDLHLSHGDTAVMLGAEPRFSVADALQNTHRLDESVLRGLVTPTSAGVDLLASQNTWAADSTLEGVGHLVSLTARLYRYVVLDLPRSGFWMKDSIGDLTRVVVVANQELSTIRRASSLLVGLQRCYGRERVSVLVSRFDPQSEIRRQDIEQVIKVPIRHVVPSDYRLALRAQNMGRPLTLDNHTRLAAAFRELSRDLAGIPAPPAAASVGSSLFGRLSGRRS